LFAVTTGRLRATALDFRAGHVQFVHVATEKTDAAPVENLRRLLAFHFRSNREAAKALGVTEHAVGLWLNGKRRPGAEALIAIDRTLDVSPRALDMHPVDFAVEVLGDRERILHAERAIGVAGKQARRSRGNTVVPLKRAKPHD